MEQAILGEFRLIKRIASGGMGEVYQAYDTHCRRYVALKKIREDLKNYQGIRKRFLSEAHIAASLTHPSIIPIFSIQSQHDPLFYTMPLLEGVSLKSLILKARQNSKLLCIEQVLSIFLSISQGVAHAHSRGFLHRDIKAENIWIDPSLEPLILDWGVAKSVSDVHDEAFSEIYADLERESEGGKQKTETSFKTLQDSHLKDESRPEEMSASIDGVTRPEGIQLTRPGKVVGTLLYLAPERALRKEVSYTSDIYSLGVLLYFMLTFHLPFRRRSLKEYLKVSKRESYIDPRTKSPFRDIPKDLVQIVDKCLKFDPQERYLTAQELIDDIKRLKSGNSDWVEHADLLPERDSDWIGKEWIYLTTPVAINEALHPEPMGWVTRMISRPSFEGHIKVRMEIKPKEDAGGMGLLLSAPEQEPTHRALDGYCIWLGGNGSSGGQLLRNGVMVLDLPGFCLLPGVSHQLTVECLGSVLHCYFDHAPKVTYVSYLPLIGSHVGLVVARGHFDFVRLHVFGGKHSLQVSCLAVPDAFLAQKLYSQALSEYRRIGSSFFDYLEGREAIFRAGITLIEWASQQKDTAQADELFESASREFEKLKGTLSAPLEWLGKSLVYREMGQVNEEIKALELACQRFSNHPLLSWLHEEVVFRLHEHSSGDLKLSSRIVLLIARALPHFLSRRDVLSRIRQILLYLPATRYWQGIPNKYTYSHVDGSTAESLAIRTAYLLEDPLSILQLCESMYKKGSLTPGNLDRLLHNAIFSLVEMENVAAAKSLIEMLRSSYNQSSSFLIMQAAVEGHWPGLLQGRFALSFYEYRLLDWLLEKDSRELIAASARDGDSYYVDILKLETVARLIFTCDVDKEQLGYLLAQLGFMLLSIKLTQQKDLAVNLLVESLSQKWLHFIENNSTENHVCDFVRSCHLISSDNLEEGSRLLSSFKQREPMHTLYDNPLCILEAWFHHRIKSLKPYLEKAFGYEKREFFRLGWLLLKARHRDGTFQLHYNELLSGELYGAFNPPSKN